MVEVTKGVFVTDYRNTSHINMTIRHISNYTGKFVCEGKPLDGKIFVKQCITPVSVRGNFGKTQVLFFLRDEQAKDFETIEALIEAYNGEAQKLD